MLLPHEDVEFVGGVDETGNVYAMPVVKTKHGKRIGLNAAIRNQLQDVRNYSPAQFPVGYTWPMSKPGSAGRLFSMPGYNWYSVRVLVEYFDRIPTGFWQQQSDLVNRLVDEISAVDI